MAKFYFACSKTIPPLPWQSFALPFSGARELVLNGVAPEYQGRGLYAALLDAAARKIDAGGQGQEPQALLSISTQINNYGVQRVWARMGLVHSQSFYTLHKWFTL